MLIPIMKNSIIELIKDLNVSNKDTPTNISAFSKDNTSMSCRAKLDHQNHKQLTEEAKKRQIAKNTQRHRQLFEIDKLQQDIEYPPMDTNTTESQQRQQQKQQQRQEDLEMIRQEKADNLLIQYYVRKAKEAQSMLDLDPDFKSDDLDLLQLKFITKHMHDQQPSTHSSIDHNTQPSPPEFENEYTYPLYGKLTSSQFFKII